MSLRSATTPRSRTTFQEEDFPSKDLREVGYKSRCLGGPRSYLGVAILSCRRLPPPQLRFSQLPSAMQPESRFLTVNIGDFWISSIYASFDPDSLRRKKASNRAKDRIADPRRSDRVGVDRGRL